MNDNGRDVRCRRCLKKIRENFLAEHETVCKATKRWYELGLEKSVYEEPCASVIPRGANGGGEVSKLEEYEDEKTDRDTHRNLRRNNFLSASPSKREVRASTPTSAREEHPSFFRTPKSVLGPVDEWVPELNNDPQRKPNTSRILNARRPQTRNQLNDSNQNYLAIANRSDISEHIQNINIQTSLTNYYMNHEPRAEDPNNQRVEVTPIHPAQQQPIEAAVTISVINSSILPNNVQEERKTEDSNIEIQRPFTSPVKRNFNRDRMGYYNRNLPMRQSKLSYLNRKDEEGEFSRRIVEEDDDSNEQMTESINERINRMNHNHTHSNAHKFGAGDAVFVHNSRLRSELLSQQPHDEIMDVENEGMHNVLPGEGFVARSSFPNARIRDIHRQELKLYVTPQSNGDFSVNSSFYLVSEDESCSLYRRSMMDDGSSSRDYIGKMSVNTSRLTCSDHGE